MNQPIANADLGALMAAVQSSDTSAYHRLLTAIAPLIRKAIRGQARGLHPSDLEDLVQDALLSIHLVRATYDSRRPFLPWMNAIARHRTIDWARRHSRRTANETADTHKVETFVAEETNMVGDGIGDPEALRRAIVELPKGQRQAIEMLKLHEMTLREASEVSGTNISALKVACQRGIKSLRSVLAAEI